MTVRIGLTGPIGCGKSAIAGWLADAGAVVIDADDVARSVTVADQPTYARVVERFGDRVVGPDGQLDRAALSAIVFADPGELAALEAIVHPAVRAHITTALAAAEANAAPAVVIEAIKLVEGGLAALCDEVWLVTCGRAAQEQRLTERGMDRSDAERRIAVQAGLTDRLAASATRIVVTDGPPSATRDEVLDALARALRPDVPAAD